MNDKIAEKPAEFEMLSDLVRSGQVPDSDVPRFMAARPLFSAWYKANKAKD